MGSKLSLLLLVFESEEGHEAGALQPLCGQLL
jgi:hypothetical protein